MGQRYYIDEGHLYKTIRVIVRRGHIIGVRALITAGEKQVKKNKTAVHIADVQGMTEEFLRRLQNKPASHDGDAGGGESMAGQGVTPLQPEPEAPSEEGGSPCAESESVSAGDITKRARTTRVLTNVRHWGRFT